MGGGDDAEELRRAVRERDERLLALEGECAKWEQRYLEEAALRQAAVSAASIPKSVYSQLSFNQSEMTKKCLYIMVSTQIKKII